MKIKALIISVMAMSGCAYNVPANANTGYCREYTQTISVGGRLESGYGTACQQPDGSWEIVDNSGYSYYTDNVQYTTINRVTYLVPPSRPRYGYYYRNRYYGYPSGYSGIGIGGINLFFGDNDRYVGRHNHYNKHNYSRYARDDHRGRGHDKGRHDGKGKGHDRHRD